MHHAFAADRLHGGRFPAITVKKWVSQAEGMDKRQVRLSQTAHPIPGGEGRKVRYLHGAPSSGVNQGSQQINQQQMPGIKAIEQPLEPSAPLPVVQENGEKAKQAEPVDAHVPEKDMEEGPASQADRERLPAEQIKEKDQARAQEMIVHAKGEGKKGEEGWERGREMK